jgi:hypothetical protein
MDELTGLLWRRRLSKVELVALLSPAGTDALDAGRPGAARCRS